MVAKTGSTQSLPKRSTACKALPESKRILIPVYALDIYACKLFNQQCRFGIPFYAT
jgi:hypothetical protein